METGKGVFLADIGGNGSRAYRCSNCNTVITYSDRLAAVSGSTRHSFTNPAGVFFEFFTFSSCPGAVALGRPTEEYSWFPGYSWDLALCKYCRNHLGWYYQTGSESQEQPRFWGILIHQILAH